VALARGEDKDPKTSTSAATADADAVAGAKAARAVEQKDQDVESKQPKNALPTPLIAGGNTAGTGLLDGGGGAATSARPDMDRARERLQLRGTEDTAQIRYGGSHRDNFLNALQRNQKPGPAPGGQEAGTSTAVASARAQQKSAATTSNAVLNTAALFSAGGLSHLSGAGLLKGRKNNPSTLPAPKGASSSTAVANTRSFFATSSNARSPPPVKGATNDAPAPDSPQRTAQYCTKRRKIVFAEKSAGPAAAASLLVAKDEDNDKDPSKQKHVNLNGGGDSDVKMDDAAVAGDDGAKANSQHSWVKPTTAAVTSGAQTASGNQKPNDQHGCTVKDKDVGAEKGGSAAAAAASSAAIPAAVRLRVGEEKPTGAAEPEKTPDKKLIAEKEAARGAPSGDKASTEKEERNKADPAPEGDEAEHEIPADTTNAKMKNAPGSARAPPPISGKRGGRKKRQAATFDDDSPPFELEAQPPSQSSVIRSTKSLRGEVAEAGPAGGGNSSSSSSGAAADTSTAAAAAAASSSSASGAGPTSSASNAANRAGSAKNGLRRYPTPILEVPEEEEEGDSNQGLQPDQIRQKALHKRGKGSSAAAAPPTDENARPDAVSTPRGGRDGGRGGSSKKKTKCKYNMDDLKKKTVPELKAILDAQNQKTTGKKEELAQRILSNPEKYPASFRTPKLKKAQGARQLR